MLDLTVGITGPDSKKTRMEVSSSEPVQMNKQTQDAAKGQPEEVCEKHGAFTPMHMPERIEDFLWFQTTKCPKCIEELRREAKAKEQRAQRERFIASLLEHAQIPTRFRGKSLTEYSTTNDDQRRALEVARDYSEGFDNHLSAGRCLAFCGKPGTGKTHLACAIAESIARCGHSVRYITASELIRWLRSSWGRLRPISTVHGAVYESEKDVLEELRGLHLLILDEVGVHVGSGSDAEVAQITEVLDMRYRDTKPTLVVSNCIPNELGRYLGERARDRLRENGGRVVVFDWPSHR